MLFNCERVGRVEPVSLEHADVQAHNKRSLQDMELERFVVLLLV